MEVSTWIRQCGSEKVEPSVEVVGLASCGSTFPVGVSSETVTVMASTFALETALLVDEDATDGVRSSVEGTVTPKSSKLATKRPIPPSVKNAVSYELSCNMPSASSRERPCPKRQHETMKPKVKPNRPVPLTSCLTTRGISVS